MTEHDEIREAAERLAAGGAISVRQFAALEGVNYFTADRLLRDGILGFHWVGNSRRIDASDIATYRATRSSN